MKGVIRGDRYFLDGREVSKELFDQFFPDLPLGPQQVCFFPPLASDAMAVHPHQVEEAREDAKRKGVPVDFLPDGRPVFTSRQQRRRYLRAYGFKDRNGGYGDG
jgi:hypothetical protein